MRHVIALALTIIVISPGVAQAHRGPTKLEQRAFDRLTGLPPNCAAVRVSTVSPRWAAWTGTKNTRRCLKFAGNGVTILRKFSGRWHRTREAGSDLVCPLPGVPRSVQVDLEPCYSWRPDIKRAREIALSAAQDKVDAARARLSVDATSTAKLEYCERPNQATVSCTLTAVPDAGGAGVQCSSIAVDVTAGQYEEEAAALAEPADCFYVDGPTGNNLKPGGADKDIYDEGP